MNITELAKQHYCKTIFASGDVRERYEFSAAELQAFAKLATAAAVLQERERCAAIAWTHFMDVCKRSSLPPARFEHWNAATSIRKGTTE